MRFRRNFSHHESWDDWLLELGFEGVHELLGFGIIKGQYAWREETKR